MFPGSDLEADPVSWSVTTSISGLRSAACVCSVSVTTFNKLTETPTALHQDDYIQIKLCVDSFSFSWLNLVSHLHLLFTLKTAAVGLNGHLALETGLSRTAEPSHRPAGSAFSIDPSADLFLSLQYFLSAASWKFRLCLSRSGLSEYL